jgi:hypothetical protein
MLQLLQEMLEPVAQLLPLKSGVCTAVCAKDYDASGCSTEERSVLAEGASLYASLLDACRTVFTKKRLQNVSLRPFE